MKQFNSLQTETKISFFVSFVLLLAEVFLVAIGVASFSWDVLDTDTELTVIMIATMQLPPVIYYFLVRFMWRDALVYMHDSDIIGITLKKLNSRKHLSRKFIIFSGFIAIRFFLVIIVFLIINRGMNAILLILIAASLSILLVFFVFVLDFMRTNKIRGTFRSSCYAIFFLGLFFLLVEGSFWLICVFGAGVLFMTILGLRLIWKEYS